MKDYKSLIIIIVLIVLFVVLWFTIKIPESNKEDVLLKKISQLELKIDSLNNVKDSLRIVIDSTHVKIINNEEHYKEVINTIVSQPDSIVDLWSKQYINDYRQRLINGQ